MHGLELKVGDSGLYVRGKYWYDFELQDDSRPFKPISDSGRRASAQSAGAQLLDAYVYHNYAIGDQPGSVRVGKQVVSWGEGEFIGGGINAINPTDVSAYRRPGTAFKRWPGSGQPVLCVAKPDRQPVCPSFLSARLGTVRKPITAGRFSQSDVMADGCSGNYRVMSKRSALNVADLAALTSAGVEVNEEGVLVRRGSTVMRATAGNLAWPCAAYLSRWTPISVRSL
jgi:hypothetical protein